MTQELTKEWIDLFLYVADACDGSFTEEDKRGIREAYRKLVRTPSGAAVYEQAIKETSAAWEKAGLL